ncbi:hypothetical protein P872_11305 [Rhodonellum psychrophilum GCM71 = DSM 17998]|uniref:Uncharacterized protein n=1 Tax=Rhodonellum psychrophilum GCM71 = DSM 17998 TaxID=1123057 RepID=U5BSD6_9BACT|nr:hypothetical protein P872_11305 [Rhodonellum psychrophilum GCM71 = DSM 17998]
MIERGKNFDYNQEMDLENRNGFVQKKNRCGIEKKEGRNLAFYAILRTLNMFFQPINSHILCNQNGCPSV